MESEPAKTPIMPDIVNIPVFPGYYLRPVVHSNGTCVVIARFPSGRHQLMRMGSEEVLLDATERRDYKIEMHDGLGPSSLVLRSPPYLLVQISERKKELPTLWRRPGGNLQVMIEENGKLQPVIPNEHVSLPCLCFTQIKPASATQECVYLIYRDNDKHIRKRKRKKLPLQDDATEDVAQKEEDDEEGELYMEEKLGNEEERNEGQDGQTASGTDQQHQQKYFTELLFQLPEFMKRPEKTRKRQRQQDQEGEDIDKQEKVLEYHTMLREQQRKQQQKDYQKQLRMQQEEQTDNPCVTQ